MVSKKRSIWLCLNDHTTQHKTRAPQLYCHSPPTIQSWTKRKERARKKEKYGMSLVHRIS